MGLELNWSWFVARLAHNRSGIFLKVVLRMIFSWFFMSSTFYSIFLRECFVYLSFRCITCPDINLKYFLSLSVLTLSNAIPETRRCCYCPAMLSSWWSFSISVLRPTRVIDDIVSRLDEDGSVFSNWIRNIGKRALHLLKSGKRIQAKYMKFFLLIQRLCSMWAINPWML